MPPTQVIAVLPAHPRTFRGDAQVGHLTTRIKVQASRGVLVGNSLCGLFESWTPLGLPPAPETTCKVCWLEAGYDMSVYKAGVERS